MCNSMCTSFLSCVGIDSRSVGQLLYCMVPSVPHPSERPLTMNIKYIIMNIELIMDSHRKHPCVDMKYNAVIQCPHKESLLLL